MKNPPGTTFPGGLGELEFIEAYRRHALAKPQVATDLALKALAFAGPHERITLIGVIAAEFAEAALRLVAVFQALGDRRYSVGRSLLRPLPGLGEWNVFVHAAATWTPEQMVAELALGDDALPHARRLRSQPDLPDLTSLLEAGSPEPLVLSPSNGADECWVASIGADGVPRTASLNTDVQDGAALADVTGDLCSIARGFLGSYLAARQGAGWRPEG